MKDINYSVLMSVYYKEKPEYLRESMLSIYNQTVPTNDFVLVCDGPLNEELDMVITEMRELFGEVLRVVRLEKNLGLGNALNIGLEHCQNELIARMDSDDISREDRCEKELQVFINEPSIDIVSGIVEEFEDTVEAVSAQRRLPENNEDILSFARKRTPFNHPCVMYRKDAVMRAGSYQDFYLLEDYYLWIRMLMNQCKGYNLQEPILWMRSGNGMFKRRGGWKYAKSQIKLIAYMQRKHFITVPQSLVFGSVRVVSAMIPNELRTIIYKFFLRN